MPKGQFDLASLRQAYHTDSDEMQVVNGLRLSLAAHEAQSNDTNNLLGQQNVTLADLREELRSIGNQINPKQPTSTLADVPGATSSITPESHKART